MGRRKGTRLVQTVRTSAEVAEVAPELTRRQLEYWVAMGWVQTADPPARGHPRTFTGREKKILAVMYRLAVAGFPARTAAWVARQAVLAAEREPGDVPEVQLVPGVRVLVDLAAGPDCPSREDSAGAGRDGDG